MHEGTRKRRVRDGVITTVLLFSFFYLVVLVYAKHVLPDTRYFQNDQPWWTAAGVLLALGALCAVLWLFARLLTRLKPLRLPEWGAGLIVIAACAIPRVLLLLNVSLTPSSDFKMYYDMASDYLHSGAYPATKYIMVVAPNLILYIATMAEFLRAIGDGFLAAEIMSVTFMVGATLMLYAFARRFLGRNLALFGTLLYTLAPNNLLYSIMPATEPMALFLMMAGMNLALAAEKSSTPGRTFGVALAAGLLLSFSNAVRAVVIAFLIGWGVYLLLYRLPSAPRKSVVWLCLAGVAVGYVGFSQFGNAVEWEVYQTELGINFGWTLYEGLDKVGFGGWTAENAAVLYASIDAYPVAEVQTELLRLALERAGAYTPSEWAYMLLRKGMNIWVFNDYAYSAVLQNNASIARSVWDLSRYLVPIANTINVSQQLVLVCFSVTGAAAVLRRRADGWIALLCLPTVFLIVFHSFATSIPRYHFQSVPYMIFCALYCVQRLSAPKGEVELC